MNIVVRSREKYCICRPDTSWERENKPVYAQEAVQGYDFAPVLFVRICKAGKCIAEKFASRYYDAFNFGILLSGRLRLGEDSGTGASVSDCLDHSSILPFPLFNPIVLENEEKSFIFQVCGKDTYIFVDIFTHISFDLQAGKGRAIATVINGRDAQFSEELHEGDQIELYWKEN